MADQTFAYQVELRTRDEQPDRLLKKLEEILSLHFLPEYLSVKSLEKS